MRRLLVPAMLMTIVACSTPAIHLTPVYPVRAERIYSVGSDSTTTVEFPDNTDRRREVFRARAKIEVLTADDRETKLRVTFTPTAYLVDGEAQQLTPEQVAEIIVGPDGSLLRIESIGGLPPGVSGASIEDIAPLLGAPLPAERVKLGQRWRRQIPVQQATANAPGAQQPPPVSVDQTGRVEAFRREHGYDCVIVRLGTVRPVSRDRIADPQPVRYEGTEYSTAEVAFAFKHGFPVRIETDAESRLSVTSGSLGGTLTAITHTVLELRSAR